MGELDELAPPPPAAIAELDELLDVFAGAFAVVFEEPLPPPLLLHPATSAAAAASPTMPTPARRVNTDSCPATIRSPSITATMTIEPIFDQYRRAAVNAACAGSLPFRARQDRGMVTVGVIEVGGTHATSALIATDEWAVQTEPRRVQLDSHADADVLIAAITSAAAGLSAAVWGIAMPDPFDYAAGIGRFHDVGKFDALDGIDLRAALAPRLGAAASSLTFCNDADAFTLGEWAIGAGRGAHRVVGLTLGTGVGSGWTVDGVVVDPGVPLGGRIHQVQLDGRPLEETMSRRAIRAAYAAATGDHRADVREIADRAGTGEAAARTTLSTAFRGLGRAIAGPIDDFQADVVVVGGSMTGSWSLFEPWLLEGWQDVVADSPPPLRLADHADVAPLIGAALATWPGA